MKLQITDCILFSANRTYILYFAFQRHMDGKIKLINTFQLLLQSVIKKEKPKLSKEMIVNYL